MRSRRRDSNPRPALYESAALPLSYVGLQSQNWPPVALFSASGRSEEQSEEQSCFWTGHFSIASAARSAASTSMSCAQCWYRSPVTPMLLCPSRLLATFNGTPALSMSVA